jgi:hypothetical protein
MTLVDVRVRLKKQVTKKIFKPKTTQKEIAKRFRVKSSFSAFKPSVKSVQEKVGGYRREEKTRFASSGLFSLLCSATSGAGILKTQVFKKPCKKYFAKKRKDAFKKNPKHRFESKKRKFLKKHAKSILQNKAKTAFKKIKHRLKKKIYAKRNLHNKKIQSNALKTKNASF